MRKSWKKVLSFACAGIMALGTANVPGMEVKAEETTLLKAGSISATEMTVTQEQPFAKGTAGSNIFRIPCLITLKDEDHKGTLVAAADVRYTEYRDFGGIDTIASVSTDNGKTWNYSFPIYFPDSNKSADWEQATTAIDPALVEGPDGTIYCFADMNPTGITTFDIWPGVGTGFVEINGVQRLVLTDTYTKPSDAAGKESSYGNPADASQYEYYVGDFDEEGFAKVLLRADHSESGYAVDEWYNIYSVKDGNYVADLTQKQVNSNTVIQQNAFYAGSVLHVYSTGYIWCVKSYDGGFTWEDPEILNTQIKRDDGKETALLVSPGQGMVTSDGDIVVGAYDTYGSENASIFYSTDNGESWKRSNDVNVTSSENEIVELPDGTLRMFYRSNTMKLCYADITKDKETETYTVGQGKEIPITVSSNCNVSAIMLEDTTIDGKPVILVSNPEGPGSWNRVKGRIFAFTLNADNSMDLAHTYAVNEDAFAYSCMTELDNGNVGILWEPGINEASAIRYDEISIAKIIGKEIELKLDPNQVYKIADIADEAAEIVTEPDEKVATVKSELEVSEGIIPLYDLSNTVASSLDSFSKTANAEIALEDAEFTFNASGSNWKIYNKATNTYLTNVNSANTFFSASADDMKVTPSTEKENAFTICRSTGSRFVIFYNAQMNFNSNGDFKPNYADGSYDMVLLEKQETVSADDEIPGYKRVSSITDGKNYLISYIWSDGSVIILYPTNGTSAQTKLVGEKQNVKTNIITFTAIAPGTTTAVVGDKTYIINVLDPATNPNYAGKDIPVSVLTATAGNEEALTSSNTTEGSAEFVLDDNTNTLWHTNWKGWSNRADHWIQFELSEGYEVDGLRYLPRSNAGGSNAYGVITKYEILVSNDGTTWNKVADGDWANTSGWKLASFGAQEVKYVRLMSVESISDNRVFSSAAEIRLTGKKAEVVVTPTPSVTEAPQPSVTEAPQPSVTEAPQPSVTEAPQPSVTEAPQPSVTEAPQPSVTEAPGEKESVTKVFSDVHKDWYTDYVQYVYDNNLMTGIKGTTKFEPNSNITKAQVAQVLYNMENQPAVTDKKVFTDLKDVYKSEWYADAVAWAYNTGVVTGDLTTKKFNPNADVTREQLALMMFRYAQYKKYDTSATSDFAGLANAHKVANWSMDGVKWAVGAGLISGVEKNGVKDLDPQGNASRAQMAAILQRFCEAYK